MAMKVLIANRGEIACRIAQTVREMGLRSVAVFTDVDAEAPHVFLCDEAVGLGEPRAYLSAEKILAAAEKTGATAIHPGYGFLSQSADFVRACMARGLVFIGPSPEAMSALGDKRSAREVAEKAGVPVVPGATACDDVDAARAAADKVGYPVLLKASGGGGGKGMRQVTAPEQLAEAFVAARREALAAFNDDRMLVEKYVYPARHVEVQILGDGKRAIALGERECSLQRRYQKIVEEAPSPGINDEIRQALFTSAVRLAEAVGYKSAGTVEFLVGPDGKHYFLEVNTRLQVEHPVTELLLGLDIVRAQIEIAQGYGLPKDIAPRGHAIEVRLNAEDAWNGFMPATGKVLGLEWPRLPHVRVDAGLLLGQEISPHYDSMVAKIIAWGATREEARARIKNALMQTTVLGVTTNQSFLLNVLDREFFVKGETFTTTIEKETFTAPEVPGFVKELVVRELKKPAQAHSTAGEGDRYSPFDSLGAFRVVS